VPGEEFIVFTSEYGGFGFREFTAEKFIVVSEITTGKMSERLHALGLMHDIRIDLIPVDRGESRGSNESSNEKRGSEFNHFELFMWGWVSCCDQHKSCMGENGGGDQLKKPGLAVGMSFIYRIL
jgi:hypothetical protein